MFRCSSLCDVFVFGFFRWGCAKEIAVHDFFIFFRFTYFPPPTKKGVRLLFVCNLFSSGGSFWGLCVLFCLGGGRVGRGFSPSILFDLLARIFVSYPPIMSLSLFSQPKSGAWAGKTARATEGTCDAFCLLFVSSFLFFLVFFGAKGQQKEKKDKGFFLPAAPRFRAGGVHSL